MVNDRATLVACALIAAGAALGCGSDSCGDGPSGSCSKPAPPEALDGGADARAAGEAGAGQGGAGQGAAGSGTSSVGPMRLEIAARAVPPGGEDHVCVTLALPNDTEVWVRAVHATLTAGSHHLIVDRYEPGTALQETPASCAPTMGGDGTRLIIAQQRETTLALPSGTALRLAPRQPVFLQLHYINLGTEPADVVGTVELEPFAGEEAPLEVQSLFTGSTSFSLPHGRETTVEYFFQPPGSAARPIHAFAMTSHTHSLGIESTIERVATQQAPDATPLHRSLDWEEPPLTTFDPPLAFDGSDGLRLRCRYRNDTERVVSFGTAFEDEMCFLWLYYYEAP